VYGMHAYQIFTSWIWSDAAIAIMVGAAIGPLSDGEPGKTVAVSAWFALLVAGILLLAAWLRLGAAADFLSSLVMLGFMNGRRLFIAREYNHRTYDAAAHNWRIWAKNNNCIKKVVAFRASRVYIYRS